MVDGEGDPNTAPAFGTAIEALYPLAYELKFTSKHDLNRDYVVPPLEALWWAKDMALFDTARDKSQWRWSLMLMVPEWIPDSTLTATLEASADTRAACVRVGWLDEGLCLQTLHVGPFDDEGSVIAHMHTVEMPAHKVEPSGTHHEIYLSDMRRTAPDRLRTILRQPVRPLA